MIGASLAGASYLMRRFLSRLSSRLGEWLVERLVYEGADWGSFVGYLIYGLSVFGFLLLVLVYVSTLLVRVGA